MKIVALNLIFGILLLTSNTNVLLSQVKILDINNISIIETKNKSGNYHIQELDQMELRSRFLYLI